MKIWNIIKNVMLSSSVTLLYAIWSKEVLHEVSTIHCAVILASVFFIFYMLLREVDKELTKIERRRQNENRRTKEKNL